MLIYYYYLCYFLLFINYWQKIVLVVYYQNSVVSMQLLRDSSHLVRCKCLELIGALGSPDHSVTADIGQSQSRTSALSVLGDFSRDPDGRVRTQSFQSMVCISVYGV